MAERQIEIAVVAEPCHVPPRDNWVGSMDDLDSLWDSSSHNRERQGLCGGPMERNITYRSIFLSK